MKRARIAAAGLTATAAAVALVATLTPLGANAVNPDNTSATTCTGPAWDKAFAYNGGDVVTYENRTYTAKWWSYSDVPGAKGGAEVWVDGGACSGTPTDEPTDNPGEPTDEPTDVPTTEPTDGSSEEPTDDSSTDPTDPTEDPTGEPTEEPTEEPTGGTGPAAGQKVIGYYTQWGTYARDFQVKDVDTSGAADKLTHINYAFGNVTGGKCVIGDSYADYEKKFPAERSVSGEADTFDQELAGNFNQLLQLKEKHPDLKVIWSFGGWTWSGGFGEAAKDPAAFAKSCHDLVEDPRWAEVFDGIDIDWEYPNATGLSTDTSGFDAYREVMKALRAEFGDDLVTSAITADGTEGGKIEAADYAGAAEYVDWYLPMTYDFYGAFNAQGPTAPHSPLTDFEGAGNPGFDSETAIAKLKSLNIPDEKLLLGVGYYGRGWTGVTEDGVGGTATGPAKGTYEAGIEDYKVLKESCPATGEVAGTAYAKCGSDWWSYDTPETLAGKMAYAKEQNLGGAFAWDLSGDTADAELTKAVSNGLS
ncbi:glycosyl hydrolase family 18 protein [Kineosporia babensis]|uniref:chitinase n=1 Tax=Kineosporia babensis TaxID=499548 RepID=A0A9X1N7I7_9ACTN|nr:glycosyl hydrolase family 18 protein [Kineosporia babensis]MCD5309872.1 glycosyl hydrolase family 18 protein [Kineosporia babensis]